MRHWAPGPPRHIFSTTIRGFRTVTLLCLTVFASIVFVFHDEDCSRRGRTQTSAEKQNACSNFASSSGGRLDHAWPRSISKGQTGFDGTSLQQYISDGFVSLPLVLFVQEVAEERHLVLPDMWWSGRRRRQQLHGGGHTAAMAVYGHLDQCGKLATCRPMATSLALAPSQGRQGQEQGQAEERQGQGSGDFAITPGRLRQRRGGARSAGYQSATNATARTLVDHTEFADGAEHRPDYVRGAAAAGHDHGYSALHQGVAAGGGGEVARRTRSTEYASACQGVAPGGSLSDGRQKRAAAHTYCPPKLCAVLALLCRAAFQATPGAIQGTGGHSPLLCGCGDEVDESARRGVGQSISPFWGHACGQLGLGRDGHQRQEACGGRSGPVGHGGVRQRTQGKTAQAVGYIGAGQGQRHGRNRVRQARGLPNAPTCGQRLQRGGWRGAAPSERSGLSLSSRYGRNAMSCVRIWTHSVLEQADFVSDFAARTIGIMLEFACRLDGLALPTLRTWGDARIWPEECEPACCSDTVLRAEPRSDLAPAAGPQTDMDNTSLYGQAAGWLSSGAVRPHGCLTASAPQLRPCLRCHLYRDRADVHNTERALRRNLRVSFSPMVTFWMPHESQLRLPTNPSSQHALRYVHMSDLQCRSSADHMPSTKRVSFDDGVSFWFPSSDQFSLCHSTRCNGNTTRVATSDRRISLYHALFPGGPSVLHESRSTEGGTLCAPLSVPAQPAKGTTHIAVRAPPPAQGSGDDLAIIDELDPAPFPRPVAATAVESEGRSRFTFFGVVEGHQVLPRQPDWTDAHCIREAIAHAAPALARPMGRTLVSPLPGLFVPQVVLTRMPPRSMYRTVVFDLRPVGAGVRAEDVRLERPVVDVFRGEGALAPLCGRMGIGAATLAFSINRLPPLCRRQLKLSLCIFN